MRSRAVRLFCAAMAWTALGGAASFLVYSERQLNSVQSDDRAFDLHARELRDTLSELRAAQRAYVATGQAAQFWMPKVTETATSVDRTLTTLRASARSVSAREAVDAAADALTQFHDADQRAREYLQSEQTLMAADVIFTEGGDSAAAASRQVEAARVAEHQARDASDARVRRQEAVALAGAGGVAAIVALLLGATGARMRDIDAPASEASTTSLDVSLPLRVAEPTSAVRPAPVAEPAPGGEAQRRRPVLPGLDAAAELCSAFGRIRDSNDLQMLVARAADAMNAAGVIVWLGSAAGADLEPVLAHGYSDEVLARMPNVPRSADNAAAAAYRGGDMQIVRSRPGGSTGALVVPIVSAEGRIGALSAELRDEGESSETVQALAKIVAAQMAAVLSVPAAEPVVESRAAASL